MENSSEEGPQFEMAIERVSSHKYIAKFPQLDVIHNVQKNVNTGYWTCSNSLGIHIYSNVQLGNCFDHLWSKEKGVWLRQKGL